MAQRVGAKREGRPTKAVAERSVGVRRSAETSSPKGARSRTRGTGKELEEGVVAKPATKAGKMTKRSAGKPLRPATPAGVQERQRKLTQVAYDKIVSAIVEGRLDLGEPLSENDLANAMQLSKAPVRESLGELRLKGLVVVVPQSGTYVFSPTPEQIGELCDFRMLLETRALRTSMQRDPEALLRALREVVAAMRRAHEEDDLFASKRLDAEFHLTIIRHSGNAYLVQSYEQINLTVDALRYRFMNTAIYREKAHNEHEKMVDLLASRQVGKAASILEDHIARTRRMQANTSWGQGRLRRKDYRFRDYASIFV